MFDSPRKMPTVGHRQFLWLWILCLFICGIAVSAVDLDKMESLAQSRYGAKTAAEVRDWRAMIERVKTLPDQEKVTEVNTYINRRVRWVKMPTIGVRRITGLRRWRPCPALRATVKISVL